METLPAIQVQDNQVDVLITQAINKNVPVETLERLLTMRERWMADKARDAYFKSMTEFQYECPIIKKTRKIYNKTGTFLYAYAPLDSIIYQVRHIMYKYGLSYAMITVPDTEYAIVSCIVRHIQGHEEVSPPVRYPLGNKTDIMSATQHYAAALTFAKRYAFCDAFGIMTGNTDTDAVKVEKEIKYISEEDIELLCKLAEQLGYSKEHILEGAKVSKLEYIPIIYARMTIKRLEEAIYNKDKDSS